MNANRFRRYNLWLLVFLPLLAWSLTPSVARAAEKDKSGVKPQVINLPSGPGSIQGLGESFQPHLNTGTASYGVPLVTPPGTGGFAPSLSLAYDGGNGNGVFGLGWRLALPSICRQTDKGLPQYSNDDLFVHNSGEELVPVGNNVYRFKVEGAFTRFRHQDDRWEATERNGLRWLLGESSVSRQSSDLGIFCWLPQRAVDTNGNEVRFFYQQDSGQLYLSEIRYNVARGIPYGNEPAGKDVSIHFEYEARSEMSDQPIVLNSYLYANANPNKFIDQNGTQSEAISSSDFDVNLTRSAIVMGNGVHLRDNGIVTTWIDALEAKATQLADRHTGNGLPWKALSLQFGASAILGLEQIPYVGPALNVLDIATDPTPSTLDMANTAASRIPMGKLASKTTFLKYFRQTASHLDPVNRNLLATASSKNAQNLTTIYSIVGVAQLADSAPSRTWTYWREQFSAATEFAGQIEMAPLAAPIPSALPVIDDK